MFVLYIAPDAETKDLYAAQAAAYLAKPRAERDAGFDLYSAAVEIGGARAVKVSQTCRAALYDAVSGHFRAYWLLPRSSISKSPLRLANSVGLIDAGYRGPLLAMVDSAREFSIGLGDRYFQLAAPDLVAFDDIRVVDELPGGATLRGAGGFGSTGIYGVSDVNYIV
jgi:dUTP pyrophosphatase